MEPFIFPVIATLAGSFFLIRNIIHLRDEKKLREYVESSPKAKLWIKKFGLEKNHNSNKAVFFTIRYISFMWLNRCWAMEHINFGPITGLTLRSTGARS